MPIIGYSRTFVVATGPVSITNTDSPVGTADQTTYTFTSASLGAAASDRVIAVAVCAGASAVGQLAVSSVTIGGVSATLRVLSQATTNMTMELWTASVPSGTTGNIVVTMNQGTLRCACGVFRIVGAASATPAHTNSNSGTGNISTTIDVPVNGAVLAAVFATDGTAARSVTWAGVTEAYDETVEGTASHSGGSADVPAGETGRTISATFSGAVSIGSNLIAASW